MVSDSAFQPKLLSSGEKLIPRAAVGKHFCEIVVSDRGHEECGRQARADAVSRPYPQVARYRGEGGTDEAANFRRMPPDG
jgi:hypothetical protein